MEVFKINNTYTSKDFINACRKHGILNKKCIQIFLSFASTYYKHEQKLV